MVQHRVEHMQLKHRIPIAVVLESWGGIPELQFEVEKETNYACQRHTPACLTVLVEHLYAIRR